jgi:RimJ/RimL family protein N-acetyltransferase
MVSARLLPVSAPRLDDGVVTLRLPGERDLAAIERGIRDPDVIRAFGHPTLSAEQVLELNRGRWDRGEAATFAICDEAGDCLGHVFVNLSADRRGSVGYWVLPEARGKGLATRAVRLVCRWALRDVGLGRLGLLTEPTNLHSLRVGERSGFHREGVLRSYAEIDGRRVDYACFSLLPSDLDGAK